MPDISPDLSGRDLCPPYHGRPGVYDEMRSPAGELREHWRTFVRSLDGVGLNEVVRRWVDAKRLIHDNGVTYNIHGDPQGLDRPWELDPIPTLISASEWAAIEAGMIQRARLLEAILADLYGPQKLLCNDRLPPELVFGHRGFLRASHGVHLPGNRFLHLAAADLGRSPDGKLWVIADRTQALSGAGYALENRIVLSRMWPDLFRDCLVQRLAMFFQQLREFLASMAPHNRDNPRVVLLTPGPYNETYFEHAYLARYLGYTLVEGGDLTVCDNRVFLKLLGGLQPVDVILRRLDDDLCDPLELCGDSVLGVPGLMQAVRAGNVAVSNPVGSWLVEAPALMPYLPTLCRTLLGESLKLDSVPSWWCGDRAALDHVLTNLQRMVIKPAFPTLGILPVFGEKLSAEERRTLADRIRSCPRDFVAQEQISLSTAPVLVGDELQPRHIGLRAFVAASNGSFTVMPGGLTRVSASADTLVVSITRGGGSKDTWVLSSTPVCAFSLLPPSRTIELSRGGGDLPSRVADNLFWLGRYAERAEGAIRLFRGIMVRLVEKSGLSDVPELPILLRALTDQGQTYPGFVGDGVEARLAMPDGELLSLLFDRQRDGSLASTLSKLHRVAGMVRDRISIDAWRILQSVDFDKAPTGLDSPAGTNLLIDSDDRVWDADLTLSDVLPSLSRMVITLAAFGGIAMESMTRGHGWRFLEMGRRLERSVHLIRLLRSALVAVSTNEEPLLEALLEIADSSMTYRRRYPAGLQGAPVLDLLLTDETNPRSLAFQLIALSEHVENLPRDSSTARPSPGQRIMLATLTNLRLADVELLARPDDSGTRPYLQDLLARIEAELPVFSDTITQNYLSHAPASRQLSSQKVEPIS